LNIYDSSSYGDILALSFDEQIFCLIKGNLFLFDEVDSYFKSSEAITGKDSF